MTKSRLQIVVRYVGEMIMLGRDIMETDSIREDTGNSERRRWPGPEPAVQMCADLRSLPRSSKYIV